MVGQTCRMRGARKVAQSGINTSVFAERPGRRQPIPAQSVEKSLPRLVFRISCRQDVRLPPGGLRRFDALVSQDHAQRADQRLLPADGLACRRDLDPDSGLDELRPAASAAGQHVARRRGDNPAPHLLGGRRFGCHCGRDELESHASCYGGAAACGGDQVPRVISTICRTQAAVPDRPGLRCTGKFLTPRPF